MYALDRVLRSHPSGIARRYDAAIDSRRTTVSWALRLSNVIDLRRLSAAFKPAARSPRRVQCAWRSKDGCRVRSAVEHLGDRVSGGEHALGRAQLHAPRD